MKIAITGGSGLVGSRIIELLGDDINFIPLNQEDVDITNKDQVWKALKEIEFDILLHLAAYTNVDGAENNKDIAARVNITGTRNIAEAVAQKKKKLIYISTDFVFDGKNPPYDENSSPHPISYYGMTKYEGEKIVKGMALVVRFSYPYRATYPYKKDFVATVKNLLEQKKTLSMVTDALITPTFIDDIAFGLRFLFHHYTPEIFHLVGSEALSPYEAGKQIAQTFGFDAELIQQTTYQQYFSGKALRPQFSNMRSKKNIYPMKSFEEGLKAVKKQLGEL